MLVREQCQPWLMARHPVATVWREPATAIVWHPTLHLSSQAQTMESVHRQQERRRAHPTVGYCQVGPVARHCRLRLVRSRH
jgi:hypothetical protein